MQKADFWELLEHPNKVSTTSFEALEKAILQYPYCLPLRLLLLRKYKENDHPAYERYLSLTALYAPDLQRVHDFISKL